MELYIILSDTSTTTNWVKRFGLSCSAPTAVCACVDFSVRSSYFKLILVQGKIVFEPCTGYEHKQAALK